MYLIIIIRYLNVCMIMMKNGFLTIFNKNPANSGVCFLAGGDMFPYD